MNNKRAASSYGHQTRKAIKAAGIGLGILGATDSKSGDRDLPPKKWTQESLNIELLW